MKRKRRIWIALAVAVLIGTMVTFALLTGTAETALESDVRALATEYGLEQYDMGAELFATNGLTPTEKRRLINEFEALETKHGLSFLGHGYEAFPGVNGWKYPWRYNREYREITSWRRVSVSLSASDGSMTTLDIYVQRTSIFERVKDWFQTSRP